MGFNFIDKLIYDIMNFQELAGKYKSELLDSVLPFWLEHSQDKQYGGYFSCLERDGSVYDTDKFVWLQGREVWLFSMLYNKVEPRKEWLECAVQGGEFLKKYGHDGDYNWYFSLTRDGQPLIDPYNIFSYTFATMAFAQLAVASGNKEYADIAKKTFDRVLEKRQHPKGKWCKGHPGTRPIKDFALPMILCNLTLEIEQLIDRKLIDETIETCLHEVMEVFSRKIWGLSSRMFRPRITRWSIRSRGARSIRAIRSRRCGLSWIWANGSTVPTLSTRP